MTYLTPLPLGGPWSLHTVCGERPPWELLDLPPVVVCVVVLRGAGMVQARPVYPLWPCERRLIGGAGGTGGTN